MISLKQQNFDGSTIEINLVEKSNELKIRIKSNTALPKFQLTIIILYYAH